ncbi:dTDP-4-dehydrorhamnose 3,5-epimerase family protein [Breoghania sp.]|uniref:dTDP-4-dehydrorhamnose 3,5-epimerase family protein n=1 Tax=Breoghania sp. TaxID=2065378 RepID=UPI002AA6C111|nr:dTDP-4-dehydrorhamnose 3,5-epimerase family protein [Breoghania sp.]
MGETLRDLPDGVELRALTPHADGRGVFLEMYREEWAIGGDLIQWNAVHSAPNVLRGVHVHANHVDYLIPVAGKLVLGLYDLRSQSPTSGRSVMLEIDGAKPKAVSIPIGVCHGFYFPVPSVHVYAVSSYWDGSDEFGCRYDDPGLRLNWPSVDPVLSEKDRDACPLEEMRGRFLAHWNAHNPGNPL